MFGRRKKTNAAAKIAPKVAQIAGKTALKGGKAQARLVKEALSSREPRVIRFAKYGLAALAGAVIGVLVSRFTAKDNVTGQQSTQPSASSDTGAGSTPQPPVASEGQTAGGNDNLEKQGSISHQDDLTQRILIRLGEDPHTKNLQHPNIEVNNGVAEILGPVPALSEEDKQAIEEVVRTTEGVVEVRNRMDAAPEEQ